VKRANIRQALRRFVPFGTFVLVLAAPEARAARPFITDDARIVEPGGYQVESYIQRQRAFAEKEFWFLPAHNPGGDIEYTLGGYLVDNSAGGKSRAVVAQAKRLLKPLETNGSGYALTLGAFGIRPPGAGSYQTNSYVNAIASFSFAEDRFVGHANLGARYDQGAALLRGRYGVGSEIAFTSRVIGIIETFGERGSKPTKHAGIRLWVVPNRVQVDATLGEERGSPAKRFQTLGIRILW
jgi:hypothetical protein